MSGSVLNGDPLDTDYHGDAAEVAVASGRRVLVRRTGGGGRLSIHVAIGVELTAAEADQIAYELACAALAARNAAGPAADVEVRSVTAEEV